MTSPVARQNPFPPFSPRQAPSAGKGLDCPAERWENDILMFNTCEFNLKMSLCSCSFRVAIDTDGEKTP